MQMNNYRLLGSKDIIKFVISDMKDFIKAVKIQELLKIIWLSAFNNKMIKVIKNQLFVHMNSPQPLSASQRGAKKHLSPFFCLQEKGAGGMSTWKTEE